MATIDQLTTIDSLSSNDKLVVYDNGNGDARKASISSLTTYLEAALSGLQGKQAFTTQHSAPSATGFSIQVTDSSDNTWLVLTPVAAYAAGTIVLPAVANVVDKQEVLVNCTQDITTLTVNKNGATAVTGAPTSITANDSFKLKYDASTSTWYKVA